MFVCSEVTIPVLSFNSQVGARGGVCVYTFGGGGFRLRLRRFNPGTTSTASTVVAAAATDTTTAVQIVQLETLSAPPPPTSSSPTSLCFESK